MENKRKISDSEMIKIIEIVKAGLNRFYSEGYAKWTQKTFFSLFNNGEEIDFDDDRIQSSLKNWEAEGFIRITKYEYCYIEVLKSI